MKVRGIGDQTSLPLCSGNERKAYIVIGMIVDWCIASDIVNEKHV